MSNVTGKIIQFSDVTRNATFTKLLKLKKRLLDSLLCATLWLGNLHEVAAPFLKFIYTVQLYKEDCTYNLADMLDCSAVALPSTDQPV